MKYIIINNLEYQTKKELQNTLEVEEKVREVNHHIIKEKINLNYFEKTLDNLE